ncbi:RebB family R body protein [Aliivibrio fischeri]|uniref:RebB family R body protein n=1 Tax=Aliivibrio fischeri TaxID=668 RepID=UPI0007C4A886|nr:RebB family R body protein [Aliivibrio fischeri]MUK40231.1 hypothetical protein [Aliivibrio fischeri]TDM51924.1 hypothetical protein VFFQA001_17635 [Aliivibrio fischeri]
MEKKSDSNEDIYSPQETTLSESTFSETMGLAMHNAITNQQQSQITTSFTVAKTCALILSTATKMP